MQKFQIKMARRKILEIEEKKLKLFYQLYTIEYSAGREHSKRRSMFEMRKNITVMSRLLVEVHVSCHCHILTHNEIIRMRSADFFFFSSLFFLILMRYSLYGFLSFLPFSSVLWFIEPEFNSPSSIIIIIPHSFFSPAHFNLNFIWM